MREAEIPVLFEPQGSRVFVLKGTRIIEAAARAGAAVNMPCGGQGTCGKCKVRVLGAPQPPTESEQRTLTQEELETGVRLACQSCRRWSARRRSSRERRRPLWCKSLGGCGNTSP